MPEIRKETCRTWKLCFETLPSSLCIGSCFMAVIVPMRGDTGSVQIIFLMVCTNLKNMPHNSHDMQRLNEHVQMHNNY